MADLVLEEDTIVAVSTPPGRGGIGIVRVSGADALRVVAPLLQLKRPLAAGRARFGFVMDTVTNESLDEAIATYFAAPRSYTGEDIVEIAVHGSPALLEHVVRICCAAGARLAEAGEFTQRAFLRGRIDLTQAEAVDDLIQSQTMQQARIAARQLGGSLARVVAPAKENLIGLIAALEAGIDFAEDDIDVMPAVAILSATVTIVGPLAELERSFNYGRVVREGFSLAIVGRPNAGKSSLFNRLVERERAIVTAMPGTTRDTVSEQVSLEGIPVELIDTAGLRDDAETDEAERIGMARSREAMAEADVVIVLVDASNGISTEDEALITDLSGRAFMVVWNKCDLPGAVPSTTQDLRVSALTGEGVAELRRRVVEIVSGGAVSSSQAMVTNVRQQQAISATVAAVKRAAAAAERGVPHEMVLLDLYEALTALDSLTGATTSDDVLHLIFSKFCIGK